MYGWVCVAWPCHKRPSPVVVARSLFGGHIHCVSFSLNRSDWTRGPTHSWMLLPSCTTHECPYPVAHLYTHTFNEGLRCTCLLTGGHGAEKVTSLIRRVLVGVLLAPCPQFASGASQHSCTWAAPGVSWCHCVLYRSAQHMVRT